MLILALIFAYSKGDTISLWMYDPGFYSRYYLTKAACRKVGADFYIFTQEETLRIKELCWNRITGAIFMVKGHYDSLYRTTDYGCNWTALDKENVMDMDIAPLSSTSSLLIVGCYNDNVYWTTDDGASWKYKNIGDKKIRRVAVSPYTVSGTYYFYYATDTAVYSKDNSVFTAWQHLPGSDTLGTITCMRGHLTNYGKLFVGTKEKGVYKWVASDNRWYSINNGLSNLNIKDIAIDFQDSLKLYLITGDGLYVSFDEGSNWNKINTPFDTLINCVYVDKNSNIFLGTEKGLYKSSDGGITWVLLDSGMGDWGYLPYAHNTFRVVAENDTIICGTYQGVFISFDGINFEERNKDLLISYITPSDVDTISKYYQEVATILRNEFGNEPDVDNDGKVIVYLSNIRKGRWWGYSVYVDGYFDPVNEYPQNVVDTLYGEEFKSNFCEIIYYNAKNGFIDPQKVKGALSTAFCKLIHWGKDPDEFPAIGLRCGYVCDFLIEGIAGYAKYIVNVGKGNTDPATYSLPLNNDLVYWGDDYLADEINYAYEFMMFIYEYYGDTVIKKIMENDLNDKESIEDVLSLPFSKIFSKFSSVIGIETEGMGDTLCLKYLNISPSFLNIIDYYKEKIMPWSIRRYVMRRGEANFGDSVYFDADDYGVVKVWVLKDPAPYTAGFPSDTLGVVKCFALSLDNENFGKFEVTLEDSQVGLVIANPSDTFYDFWIDPNSDTLLPPHSLEWVNEWEADSVVLKWSPPVVTKEAKITGYNVYRRKESETTYTKIAGVITPEYIDKNVLNETTYYYVVTALYNRGESGYSEPLKVTPTHYPPPGDFRASGGYGKVFLTWSLPRGVSMSKFIKSMKMKDKGSLYFRLYRSKTSGGPYVVIAPEIYTLFYIDTSVMLDSTYYYVIKAIYSTGESPYSDECSTTVSSSGGASLGYRFIESGELWTAISNFGSYGHPGAGGLGVPSYNWPGSYQGEPTYNYYLYEGGLWLGAKVSGEYYVSTAFYDWELAPTADCKWELSEDSLWFSITVKYCDYDPDYNSNRGLGFTIIEKMLHSLHPAFDDFYAFEYKIIYDKNKALISNPPDTLTFYIGWWMDADISGAEPYREYIDDWVCWDGWTNHEWDDLPHGPKDSLTILYDHVLNKPDGVLDNYVIWGDDEWEMCLSRPDTIMRDGEILAVQLIPRDMAYIYDGDNPSIEGNDAGYYGASAGYFFGKLLYAPPSPSDNIWVDEQGRQCRLIRPVSFAWWNWEEDPGNDEEQYKYMTGTHPAMHGYHFKPHPQDLGASEFDYRFLVSYGPYTISSGDTLEFVYVLGVGQGLNGGIDDYWERGYRPGARHIADIALMAYYMGAQNSDPLHPSAPSEDIHWNLKGIPISLKSKRKFWSFNLFSYPNPFADNLIVIYTLPQKSKIELNLYDLCGRLVKVLYCGEMKSGINRAKYDMRELPAGVYILKMKAGDKIINRKIIKVK